MNINLPVILLILTIPLSALALPSASTSGSPSNNIQKTGGVVNVLGLFGGEKTKVLAIIKDEQMKFKNIK